MTTIDLEGYRFSLDFDSIPRDVSYRWTTSGWNVRLSTPMCSDRRDTLLVVSAEHEDPKQALFEAERQLLLKLAILLGKAELSVTKIPLEVPASVDSGQ